MEMRFDFKSKTTAELWDLVRAALKNKSLNYVELIGLRLELQRRGLISKEALPPGFDFIEYLRPKTIFGKFSKDQMLTIRPLEKPQAK